MKKFIVFAIASLFFSSVYAEENPIVKKKEEELRRLHERLLDVRIKASEIEGEIQQLSSYTTLESARMGLKKEKIKSKLLKIEEELLRIQKESEMLMAKYALKKNKAYVMHIQPSDLAVGINGTIGDVLLTTKGAIKSGHWMDGLGRVRVEDNLVLVGGYVLPSYTNPSKADINLQGSIFSGISSVNFTPQSIPPLPSLPPPSGTGNVAEPGQPPTVR